MKKKILAAVLSLAAQLYSMSASAALPTVQVPPLCNVVVAGIGGITGFGGKVGHGGVVAMPDPFDDASAGGDFTFLSSWPAISWDLKGDLSFQTGTPQSGPVPGTAPIWLSAQPWVENIESYNARLRPAELLSDPVLGRSKGWVHLEYNMGDSCGNSELEFEVYKVWVGPNPAIIGPGCWPEMLGGLITYSVDQVCSDNMIDAIGIDQYYWSFANLGGNGNELVGTTALAYTSGDRSSITFDSADPAFTTWYGGGANGPYILTCCFGRAIGWDSGTGLLIPPTSTTCVKKTMIQPVAPTYSPGFPSCVNTGVTTFPTVIMTNASLGYTYTWTCSDPAWTLAPSGTWGQNLTVSTMNDNSATITLVVGGPCAPVTYTYQVNRTFLPPLAVTSTSTCVLAGSQFTLNLPATAQGNCTTWSGVSWPRTGGTGSITTFTVPTGTPAGVYHICASNCTCPGTRCITINVKPASPSLAQPSCVPTGTGPAQVYSCGIPPGVCSTCFTWSNTFLPTWTANPPFDDNSESLNPSGNGSGQVSVIARGTNGCNSTPATITVNRSPTTPTINQPACFNVGINGTGVFTVTNPQVGSTYTWGFPAGFSASGGTTGTSVTRTTIGTPGTYACTVINTNGPCPPTVLNFIVNVAYTAGPVTATNNGTWSSVGLQAVAGATSYQLWDCSISDVVTSPSMSNVIPLNGIGGSFSYSILVTLGNGCVNLPPCVITAHHNSMIVTDEGAGDLGADLTVMPNPNSGTFTLMVPLEFEVGTVIMYDAQGRIVQSSRTLQPGANELGDNGLVPGLYTIVVSIDGQIYNRTISVNKE